MKFWDYFEKLVVTKNDKLPAEADVVIATGIDVSKNGSKASPQSKAVALMCAELFKARKAKNVLLAGGYSAGGATEAELMAEVINGQIPLDNLYIENKSTSTVQNADYTLRVMKEKKWKTAIIVSQQLHARRARATFRKQWKNNEIKLYVIKAKSPYGGGSQKRLNHFCRFLLWEIYSFIAFFI